MSLFSRFPSFLPLYASFLPHSFSSAPFISSFYCPCHFPLIYYMCCVFILFFPLLVSFLLSLIKLRLLPPLLRVFLHFLSSSFISCSPILVFHLFLSSFFILPYFIFFPSHPFNPLFIRSLSYHSFKSAYLSPFSFPFLFFSS